VAVTGIMLPPEVAAPRLLALAARAEQVGVDELWVPEDLGLHGGVALATALLGATDAVPVGLGIAPAAARHPAFLAMQAATIAQLHPGRFRLGIGHGMPGWMRGLGIWPASPLARLEETLVVVRRLLAGDRVGMEGREVQVDDLVLTTTPVEVPLYAGVRGPRSLEVAGRHADGVVLAGWAGPSYVTRARRTVEDAAGGASVRVVASLRFALDGAGRAGARERLVADLVRAGTSIADMLPDPARAGDGPEALLDDVGVAGDLDDLRAGIGRWDAAGADVVLLDPLTVDDLELLLAGGAFGT
jgi:5,10-methylenetetrahydromethanopterin reductase